MIRWLADQGHKLGVRRASSILTVIVVVAFGISLTLRPRPAPALQNYPMAPGFSLPAVSSGGLPLAPGGMLRLRALRGHPVLLNFFLSNCGPCLDELPLLRQTAQAYGRQGLVVIGVATLNDTADAARRLAAATRLTYPVVIDDQATAWQYGVSDVPTSLFVDARGRLVGQHIGPLDRQAVRNGLAQAGAISCPGCGSLEPLSIAAVPASSTTFSADFTFAPPKAAPFSSCAINSIVSYRRRGCMAA